LPIPQARAGGAGGPHRHSDEAPAEEPINNEAPAEEPIKNDERRPSSPGSFVGDIPGAEEVPSVAWPLLLRDRVRHRVEASDRYRWWVLWTVLSGLFAAGFSFTILAVAIPDIAADLGGSETTAVWVVSGPMLVFALAMPVLGKAGDIYGHRRVYLTGLGLFVVFTGLSTLAWNAPALIGIRTLAAVEGAATGPASMALIMLVFPPEDRVKAMGFFSLIGAGAPVIGLVAGGLLIDAFGWRALFVVQLPLGLLALTLATTVLRETPRHRRGPIDVRGAASIGVAAAAALLALDRGNAWGWANPAVVGLIALAPLGVVSFVSAERRAPNPLVPLEFFRRRNFSLAMVAQFFGNTAYMGGFIISPLLVQHVFGYSVAAAALVMLWRPLTFSLTSPLAGYAAVRVGERSAAVAGAALISISMLVFAAGASGQSLTLVVTALVLSGIGMGLASPSLQSSVANAVEEQHLGIAGAAQQMAFMVGAAAGIQLLSMIQSGARVTGPFVDAYLVGAALAAVGLAAATGIRSLERRADLRVAAAA
jgi:EmrB/QacA subfamily drug resistance transporter